MNHKESGFTLVSCLLALLMISLTTTAIFRIEQQFRYHSLALQDLMQNETTARSLFIVMEPLLQNIGYTGCRSFDVLHKKMPLTQWIIIIEGSRGRIPKTILKNQIINTPILKINIMNFLTHPNQNIQQGDLQITYAGKRNIRPHQSMVISDCLHTEFHHIHSVGNRRLTLESPIRAHFNNHTEVGLLETHWYYIGRTKWHYTNGKFVTALYHYSETGFHEALTYGIQSWQLFSFKNGIDLQWQSESALPNFLGNASPSNYHWHCFIRYRNALS